MNTTRRNQAYVAVGLLVTLMSIAFAYGMSVVWKQPAVAEVPNDYFLICDNLTELRHQPREAFDEDYHKRLGREDFFHYPVTFAFGELSMCVFGRESKVNPRYFTEGWGRWAKKEYDALLALRVQHDRLMDRATVAERARLEAEYHETFTQMFAEFEAARQYEPIVTQAP